MTTGWQMLFGGFVLVVSGAIAGEHVGTPSGESAWAWAYLVVIGALVAYTSYTWLLRNAPISKVSTYAYVNPVVAVILGAHRFACRPLHLPTGPCRLLEVLRFHL